jgi:hypothetical protein
LITEKRWAGNNPNVLTKIELEERRRLTAHQM